MDYYNARIMRLCSFCNRHSINWYDDDDDEQANVEGAQCNRCRPNTFYLSESSPSGCTSCFCMGVTQQCTSGTWTRTQVRFISSTQSSASLLTTGPGRSIGTVYVSLCDWTIIFEADDLWAGYLACWFN